MLQRAIFEGAGHTHAEEQECAEEGAADSHKVAHHKEQARSIPGIITLLLALGVHSVLEGMALGLQQSKEGVIFVFVGVITHQWAEDFVFALSTRHLTSLPLRFFLSFLEAITCPIGIAIGWGIGERVTTIAIAFILAFSSGTFLMIAASEIVPEVMPQHKRSTWAFLAFFVGAGLMYMLFVLMFDPAAHQH